MNRKSRKLDYIRQKNKINKGNELIRQCKVSNEFLQSYSLDALESHELNALKKRWKMDFKVVNTSIGQTSRDYLMNTKTIRYTIKKSNEII